MENHNKDQDRRNVQDKYKGMALERIVDDLAKKRNWLEVAIENVDHDFNMGTIIRTANNFNVAKVHVIGRRKYNRRGAMCTEKYLEVEFWEKWQDFVKAQREFGREIVAIENNMPRARLLGEKKFVENTTLAFGSEKNGISAEFLSETDDVREIEGFGSTRSVNVGVAAGIAMYEWVRQCVLDGKIE